ncbi:MAG: hypothetical protein QOJ79_1705 [Actinomycetota bacterium]|nr:hypothetical protein [Actinomycetota bacterium]
MPGRRRSLLAFACSAALLAALGLGAPAAAALAPAAAGDVPATAHDASPRPNDAPVATTFPDPTNPTGCDRTMVEDRIAGADGSACMLPFPNDLFTTGTGAARRLNLPVAGMPKDAAGKPINPLPYAASDGFSPGSLIVAHVPGLDNPAALAKTGAASITDMAKYADPAAPIVLVDVQTGKRWPIWVEIDVNPLGPFPNTLAVADAEGSPNPQPDPRPTNTANVNLLIHPAKNLTNGHRYVVGMRFLKDAGGNVLPATDAFKTYRNPAPPAIPNPDAPDSRRAHFDQDIFPVLTDAGFARADLYQAWDFSVASATNIAGRLLHMRDDAFHQLGDDNLADRVVQGTAPAFTVDTVTEATNPADEVRRTVQGSFTVPCYINTPKCAPGGSFAYAPTDVDQTTPLQLPGNVSTAKFTCKVPRRVFDSPTLEKVRPSLYGHGLFGGQSEVGQGQVSDMVQEHGFMYCATDWEGMATVDISAAAQADADMDRFPALTDHVQQGELNFLYLARLMIHPQGFVTNPAFQVDKGAGLKPFIDTTRAYYDGNSQGGIYGGTVLAVAPDIDRGILGVPGINYSTLLTRSKDFALYSVPLYTTYPSEFERPLLLSIIQILWDRSDPDGYVNQLTDQPLPNTPPHKVMYQVSFGDHQVANVTADTAARTAGAAVDPHPVEDGRSPDVTPVWGVPRIASYPYDGSAIVYFDSGPDLANGGTPAAPMTNTPPKVGQDPHEFARRTKCGRVMKNNFLRPDGVVTNPCLGAPYFSNNYHGRTDTGQGYAVQAGDAIPYPTPTGPGPAVPEAPYTVLLLLAAAGTVAFVVRRRQSQLRSSHSSG